MFAVLANEVGGGGLDLVPIVVVVAVCGVVYIVLMVALGVWCYRRCQRKGDTKPCPSSDVEVATLDDVPLSEFEIGRSQLERGSNSLVGSGWYWTVYKAELKRQKTKGDNSVTVSVLVKEFHEKGFSRDKFMADVMAVKSLQHASVARLVGVCTSRLQPYLMVTENLDQVSDVVEFFAGLLVRVNCFVVKPHYMVKGLFTLDSKAH